MYKNDSDYRYFNLIINNDTNHDMEATYDERKIQPFLSDMSDYKIGIIRWKVPSFYIPMFQFQANHFYVTLGLPNGDNYEQAVTWEVGANTNNVYDYETFIYRVNMAFRLSFTALLAAHGVYNDLTAPPVIYYDSDTKNFMLAVEMKDADEGNIYAPDSIYVQPISIYFNANLFKLFNGFSNTFISSNGNRNYRINVLQTINNKYPPNHFYSIPNAQQPVDGYIIMKTNYPCLFAWHKLARIIITTTLPIETEDIGARTGSNSKLGLPISQAILTDFEVIKSDQALREPTYYFTNNDKRYVNFTANGPLKEMNLSIFWEDDELNVTRLVIPPGGECYIKLQFLKINKNK
jgi:hypothetical protein